MVRHGARNLPPTLRVRAIRYRRRGFRPQTLLTSLLDPVAYPAAELVALYHERWELELGFDEVKTHTLERAEAVRSKTPARVTQEVWGLALGYNLVRLAMARVAARAGVAPTRVSIVTRSNSFVSSGSRHGPRALACCRAVSRRFTTNSPCSSSPSAAHTDATLVRSSAR